MNCCDWFWLTESLDDSGIPLVNRPSRPRYACDLDRLTPRPAPGPAPCEPEHMAAALSRSVEAESSWGHLLMPLKNDGFKEDEGRKD